MKINEIIKELREDKNIKIPQMAKELKMKHQNIYRWENGENIPTLEQAIKLADYFNVTLDYLVGREF